MHFWVVLCGPTDDLPLRNEEISNWKFQPTLKTTVKKELLTILVLPANLKTTSQYSLVLTNSSAREPKMVQHFCCTILKALGPSSKLIENLSCPPSTMVDFKFSHRLHILQNQEKIDLWSRDPSQRREMWLRTSYGLSEAGCPLR